LTARFGAVASARAEQATAGVDPQP
jgi:hypothetical protein